MTDPSVLLRLDPHREIVERDAQSRSVLGCTIGKGRS
jgi:hypothetical protein